MSLAIVSLDSFKCKTTVTAGGKTYEYFSLPLAEMNGLAGISSFHRRACCVGPTSRGSEPAK